MEQNSGFKVEDLSFAYDKKPVLRHLSFEIQKGKITTIMGSNGCGKSTLFQLMTKNLKPVGGQILLNDRDIDSMSLKNFARQVAIVHQYNTAPSDLTVEKLVGYGRTPYLKYGMSSDPELDEKMIRHALKITGTYQYKDRFISELSGGQKQRVWIAMALAQGTDTIFLDEPTTYLDVRYQIELLRLVRELNRKYGTTIVMILHDINQAIAYSDEVIALSQNGEIVVKGKPKEVINETALKEIYNINLEIIYMNDRPFVLTF